MEKINNLVIGQGIGPAKFLMQEDEITALFGKPDESETSEENGEKILTLYYDKMQTDFIFEEADDGRFLLTSFLCTNPNLVLDNKIKFGATEEEFSKYAKALKTEASDIQTDPDTNEKFVFYEDLGLMVIFTEGKLSAVQLEYWEDEDTEE